MPPAKEGIIPNNMASPSRRVVKAKAPPPPSLHLPKPAPEDDEEVDVAHVSYALGSPSVERELEQEKVNKWRKERLEGMAAKQKMERDKEVLERRQSNSTPTRGITGEMDIPQEVLQEFSVEPKYPEHKRSGDTLSGISDGEPQGKRRKSSMDEEPKKVETDNIARATKMVVVTAALAAAVAIGVAIFRRASGRG